MHVAVYDTQPRQHGSMKGNSRPDLLLSSHVHMVCIYFHDHVLFRVGSIMQLPHISGQAYWTMLNLTCVQDFKCEI